MSKPKSREFEFDDWDIPEDFPEEQSRKAPVSTRSNSGDDWAEDTWEEDSRSKRRYSAGRRRGSGRAKNNGIWLKLLAGIAAVAAVATIVMMFTGGEEPGPGPNQSVASEPYQFSDVPETTLPEITQPMVEPETTETVPYVEPRDYRYFGSLLSESEKRAYDILLDALLNHAETVEGVHLATEERLGEVMHAVTYDYAELFWFDGAYSYQYYQREGYLDFTVMPEYQYSQSDSAQMTNFVDTKIQGLLDALYGKSEYEKVKGVYEYLIDHTAYDYAYTGETLYQLFSEGRAVCDAYARSMQYILNRLDVEVIYVVGDAGSPGDWESHAWNIVKIDGDYYQIDATWGDPYSEDGTQSKNFTYFCLTDQEMFRDHMPNDKPYPACTATACNYFVYEGRFLDSYDTERIKQWMAEAQSQGVPLSFRMANATVYWDVKTRLIDNREIYPLFEEAVGAITQYFYSSNDEMFILEITW